MPAPLSIVLGLIALVVGAELLVRGGSQLAARLGISPILIGLTVVSLGTSMPELAVGIQAATAGSGGLAVGNIVGTNIVNLLLILGMSALLRPLPLETRTLRLDLPAMVVASILLWVLSLNRSLGRWEGVLLLAAGVLYTVIIIRSATREPPAVQEEFEEAYVHRIPGRNVVRAGLLDLVLLLVGIAVIVLGSDWLVDGAVEVAVALGVSDAVIGLTIVAIGTSAPELVTTVISTIRGDRDIAIGNLLGSSVYNILFILGITMIASPGPVIVPPEVLQIDLVVMVLAALVAIPVFRSGAIVRRWEGGLFVMAYVGYLAYLLTVRL